MVYCTRCLNAGHSYNSLSLNTPHNRNNVRCPSQPWNIAFWNGTTNDGTNLSMPIRADAVRFKLIYQNRAQLTNAQHLVQDQSPPTPTNGNVATTTNANAANAGDANADAYAANAGDANADAYAANAGDANADAYAANAGDANADAYAANAGNAPATPTYGTPNPPPAPAPHTYNEHNQSQQLQYALDADDDEYIQSPIEQINTDLLTNFEKGLSGIKDVLDNYIMITKKQNEVIKEKTRKNKEMKKELRIYKRDIYHLNAELDIMDERLYSYTATITDLEKQLKPRDDDKGKSLEVIMEVVENHRHIMGDGPYKALMDTLGTEYNT